MNIPAFPAMHFDLAENEHGMTLRDYFAAKAMQGMLAASENYGTPELGLYAYEIADSMLKAREQ